MTRTARLAAHRGRVRGTRDGRWIWVDSIISNHLHDPEVGYIVTSFRRHRRASRGRTRVAGSARPATGRWPTRRRSASTRWTTSPRAALRQRAMAGDHGIQRRGLARTQLATDHPPQTIAGSWPTSGPPPAPRASRSAGMVAQSCGPTAVVRWVMSATEPLLRRRRTTDGARRHARRHHRTPRGAARHGAVCRTSSRRPAISS